MGSAGSYILHRKEGLSSRQCSPARPRHGPALARGFQFLIAEVPGERQPGDAAFPAVGKGQVRRAVVDASGRVHGVEQVADVQPEGSRFVPQAFLDARAQLAQAPKVKLAINGGRVVEAG